MIPQVARLLLDYDDDTTRRLKRLELKIDAVLAQPYEEGLDYVRSIAETSDVDDQRTYALEATRAFRRAAAGLRRAKQYEMESLSALNAGIMYFTLNDRSEADRWAKDAYIAAIKELNRWVERANSRLAITIGRVISVRHTVGLGGLSRRA